MRQPRSNKQKLWYLLVDHTESTRTVLRMKDNTLPNLEGYILCENFRFHRVRAKCVLVFPVKDKQISVDPTRVQSLKKRVPEEKEARSEKQKNGIFLVVKPYKIAVVRARAL